MPLVFSRIEEALLRPARIICPRSTHCPRTAHFDGDGNYRAREITDVRAKIVKDTRRKH